MRLLRGNVPLVLDEYDYRFELGKAKLLRDGNDVLIISTGFMTMRALEAARRLAADHVDVAVLHVPDDQAARRGGDPRGRARTGTARGRRREPHRDRRTRRGGRQHAAARSRAAGRLPARRCPTRSSTPAPCRRCTTATASAPTRWPGASKAGSAESSKRSHRTFTSTRRKKPCFSQTKLPSSPAVPASTDSDSPLPACSPRRAPAS